jgi:CRP/FNR family cyclic AMP-dependent transcriptional regulator
MGRKKSTVTPDPASALLERFEGTKGRRLLLEVMREQKMVAGNAALARKLADQGKLLAVPSGKVVIEQGGADSKIYLVLAGSFDIVANGTLIAKRYPSDHIGEMAAIQPTQRRSATVIANQHSVLLEITEPQLVTLGTAHPDIYRQLAKELAKRLLERNNHLTAKRDKIRIFVMSSSEALEVARAVETALHYDPFDVCVWSAGVFRASHYPIDSLERELDRSDFAIAIAQPDDAIKSRGKTKATPRDNVIFELGLFIGRIGRLRSLLLEPQGEVVKLPSDLTGLTTISYKPATGRDLAVAIGPACSEIRQIISELGPR